MKSYKLEIFAVLTLGLGCNGGGGDGPSNTSTVTTSVAGPSAAIVTMEVVDFGFAGFQGSGALFGLQLRLVESAGLGANVNFLRLDVLRATGELEERSEVGADEIVNALGTNRLDASSTWEQTVTFFFRATVKKGRRLVVTADLTDDKGNPIERTTSFIFN